MSPTAREVGVKEGYDVVAARRRGGCRATSGCRPRWGRPVFLRWAVMNDERMQAWGRFAWVRVWGELAGERPTAKRAVFDLEGDGFDEIDVGLHSPMMNERVGGPWRNHGSPVGWNEFDHEKSADGTRGGSPDAPYGS
ncbi:uncharacterized protein A4U43_C05F26720 [Asparagus officinalis]|uniref:Uncharacterized protein n=1 Tax=Asparagus officinalis TaxID=4686 RepID=A0A5P1EUQ7_ASPOF|nr:uncharacterized protein A4U43_C05F26720 [Asparagus officinalis]